MTNNEIDYKLARAIGWPDETITRIWGQVFIYGSRFEHRDWRIAGPVAECVLGVFPRMAQGVWIYGRYGEGIAHKYAQTAIALAVIRECGK